LRIHKRAVRLECASVVNESVKCGRPNLTNEIAPKSADRLDAKMTRDEIEKRVLPAEIDCLQLFSHQQRPPKSIFKRAIGWLC
jgi:hypothetical protein